MLTLNGVTKFDGDYARVQLFGHSLVVGLITSVEIGGMDFLEVTYPKQGNNALCDVKTKYFTENAIFGIELITVEEYGDYYAPKPEIDDLPF